MISIRSEHAEIIKLAYSNFGYNEWTITRINNISNSKTSVQRIHALCRNGFAEKTGFDQQKRHYIYKLKEKSQEIIDGNYTISNQCIICGKIHQTPNKTCSEKCMKEYARKTYKLKLGIKDEYKHVIKDIEKKLKEKNYPLFVGRYTLDLQDYGLAPTALFRVFHYVLEKNGYIEHKGRPRRVYIRADRVIEDSNTCITSYGS